MSPVYAQIAETSPPPPYERTSTSPGTDKARCEPESSQNGVHLHILHETQAAIDTIQKDIDNQLLEITRKRAALSKLQQEKHDLSQQVSLQNAKHQYQSIAHLLDEEADRPNEVICQNCTSFHPRLNRRQRFTLAPTTHNNKIALFCMMGNSKCSTNREILRSGRQMELYHWWYLHLAMRAHRPSPSHGIPLKQRHPYSPGYGHWGSASWLKIHDGRMLAHIRSLRILDRATFSAGSTNMPTCRHPTDGPALPRLCKEGMAKFKEHEDDVELFADRVVYRCGHCPSEYAVAALTATAAASFAEGARRYADLQYRGEKYGPFARIDSHFHPPRPAAYVVLAWYVDIGPCISTASRERQGLTAASTHNQKVLQPFDMEGLPNIVSRFEQDKRFQDRLQVKLLE